MLKLSTFLVPALLTLTVLVPCRSFADTVGNSGKLTGLREINSASDDFSTYRGAVIVDEGKGVLQEYVWGGGNCPARDLTEDEIANLALALGNGKLRIVPSYTNGQIANTRCLVQFLLGDKKTIGAVPPTVGNGS